MTVSEGSSPSLRTLLERPEPSFLMEAHSGLSARIVEEAGFEGIWASGLSISATLGVRDANEASWTQVLDSVEYMADATSIPILLDGDTGYGNFNNVRRLVTKLEQRGVAGVCLEDKLFPKQNSFIDGKTQPLADIKEFSGKIQAAKDTQQNPDFCVVARVEALIAGHGQDAALERAAAYADAGADAILIHSALRVGEEILAFCEAWDNRKPLVAVPTKYPSVPAAVLHEAGVSLIIWANHLVRASISAMQRTASLIHASQSVLDLPDLVDVDEIFRLQNVKELKEAELRYLPT
ncbi:MAG: phosphoenolpyruvate mutase [Acidimicrobiia bacterium]|nr:phosphoenolpyruvate mutase [Acidimicrobiia bacterium]